MVDDIGAVIVIADLAYLGNES
nr:hypothetical protein [Sulfurimonas sp.]